MRDGRIQTDMPAEQDPIQRAAFPNGVEGAPK